MTCKNIFLLSFFMAFASCKQVEKQPVKEFTPVNIGEIKKLPVQEDNSITVPIPEVDSQFNIAEWIEDFKYLPLETTDGAYMGQYRKVLFHKDRIYVFDIESNLVNIFDMYGKHIRTIGQKSDAPDGLVSLWGFLIDPFQERVMLYDYFARKMVYYTLEGDFLFKRDMPFSSEQSAVALSPNCFILVGGSRSLNKENGHLGELKNYQLYYTDSLLHIKEVAYLNPHPDLGYIHPKCLQPSSTEPLFFSHYFNHDLDKVTEAGISLAYRLDYSKHTDIFTLEKAMKAPQDSKEGGWDYMHQHNVTYDLYETPSSLLIKTAANNFRRSFYTYFDKQSKKSISFPNESVLSFTSEFIFSSFLGVYKDYIVAYVEAEKLKLLRNLWKKHHRKMDEQIADMIDGLHDDDNAVLVFLKFKPIQ